MRKRIPLFRETLRLSQKSLNRIFWSGSGRSRSPQSRERPLLDHFRKPFSECASANDFWDSLPFSRNNKSSVSVQKPEPERSVMMRRLLFCQVVFVLLALVLSSTVAQCAYRHVSSFGGCESGQGEPRSLLAFCVGPKGTVYTADMNVPFIHKFDPAGKYLGDIGSADNAPSLSMCCSGDFLYIAEVGGQIVKVDLTSAERKVIHKPKDMRDAILLIAGIAVDARGNIFVSDSGKDHILKLSPSGQVESTFGSSGTGAGELSSPTRLAISPDNHLYVVDSKNDRIQCFGLDGKFIASIGSHGSGNGQFDGMGGIAIDVLGDLYVVDIGNHRVQVFKPNHTFAGAFGSRGITDGQFDHASGIALSPDGSIYVTDYVANKGYRIQRFARAAPGCATSRCGSSAKCNGTGCTCNQNCCHCGGMQQHVCSPPNPNCACNMCPETPMARPCGANNWADCSEHHCGPH